MVNRQQQNNYYKNTKYCIPCKSCEYSGTPLNDHTWFVATLSMADTHLGPDYIAIQNSRCFAATSLLDPYFRGSNCTQTILNDPDLADTFRPFPQDCPPSLL